MNKIILAILVFLAFPLISGGSAGIIAGLDISSRPHLVGTGIALVIVYLLVSD